jgi:hypothetical protein
MENVNLEPTEEKIARVEASGMDWIQEPEDMVERQIRMLAATTLNYSSGASVGVHHEEELCKKALKGYEDIWEIKREEQRGLRIVRK